MEALPRKRARAGARLRMGQRFCAIRGAGGPRYRALSIAPRNDADGGVPGANIRPAFLYNPRRLQPVAKRTGTTTTPARLERRPLRLTPNPGRIATGAGARQRRDQTRRIAAFLQRVHRRAPHLPVMVLGDFNAMDFETALRPLATLRRPALHDLLNNLKPVERYTYVYQGNGEALDHLFVGAALARGARETIVHANSGRRNPVSDHDPVVAQLR